MKPKTRILKDMDYMIGAMQDIRQSIVDDDPKRVDALDLFCFIFGGLTRTFERVKKTYHLTED